MNAFMVKQPTISEYRPIVGSFRSGLLSKHEIWVRFHRYRVVVVT